MSCEIIPYLLCATVIIYIFMEIKYAGRKKISGLDSVIIVLLFIACVFTMFLSVSKPPSTINTQWQNLSTPNGNN